MKPGAAPVGAQTREQHVPPQSGGVVVDVPQTLPLGEHWVAPGAETAPPQTPSVAPACFTQLPPQQSALAPHASPTWVQNATVAQSPLLQSFEQQSVPVLQLFPVVLHVVLSGLQMPPPLPSGLHVPPQQSSFLPQG